MQRNSLMDIPNEKMESNSKKIEWQLAFYLFLVIFSPPILPGLNILIPVTIFSIISLYRNYEKTLFTVIKKSLIFEFMKLYLFCYGLVFAMVYLNIIRSGDFYFINFATNIYRLFVLMGCLFVCILYFLVRAEALGYKFTDVFRVFSRAILIQVIIGLLAFFIPSIKSFLLTVMAENTGSEVFFREGLFSYGYTYRYNGFAGTLLDTFGYGMGLVSGVAVIIGFFKHKKYLLWAIIFLIPSVLNSRTGLLIAAMGFVIAFVFSLLKASPRRMLQQFAGFFAILLVVGIVFYITAINSPSTVGWILDGFESIFDLLTGQEVRQYSTADQLFSDDFWTIPNNILGLMFGEGYRVYGMTEVIGFASDVGYVNHIWLTGIVGSIFMYAPFVYLFISTIFYNKYNFSTAISVYLGVSFFVMLIKGDMIGYNTGMFVNLLIPFLLTYDYSTRTNVETE